MCGKHGEDSMRRMRTFACLIPLIACLTGLSFAKSRYASHPPMRPLPEPSDRPAGKNPTFYVDSSRGNDANPGTKAKPWRVGIRGRLDLNGKQVDLPRRYAGSLKKRFSQG